jgi:hypothetical protein
MEKDKKLKLIEYVTNLNIDQKHELIAMWIVGIREQEMENLDILFILDDERNKVYTNYKIKKGFDVARILSIKHCLNLIYN